MNIQDRVGIAIDASEAEKGRKLILKYLSDIDQRARKTGSALDDSFDIDSRKSVRGVDDLSDSLDDATKSSRNLERNSSDAFDNIEGGAGRASLSMRDLATRAGVVVAGVAAAGAVILNFADKAGQAAFEIKNLSSLSNTTVEEFQRMAYAFKSVGIEQDKMADIFKDSQEKVGDYLQNGAGPLADYFENIAPKIGQTAEEFRNLSGPQVIQKYTEGLKKANLSQSEMIFYLEAMASDLGIAMPLFEKGSKGVQQFGIEAEKTGAVLTAMEIEKLTSMREETNKFKNSLGGNTNKLIATFADEIEIMAKNSTQLMGLLVEEVQGVKRSFQEVDDLSLDNIYQEISRVKTNLMSEESDNFLTKLGKGFVDFQKKTANLQIKGLNTVFDTDIPQFQDTGTASQLERVKELEEEAEKRLKDLHNGTEELNSSKKESNKIDEESSSKKDEKNKKDEKSGEIISSNTSEYDKLAQARKRNLESIQSEISKLKMTTAVFGKSEAEVVKYRIAHGDLGKAIESGVPGAKAYSQEILEMTEQLAKVKDMKEAEDILDGINQKMKEIGKTGSQKAMIEVESKIGDNVSDEMVERIKQAQTELYKKQEAQSFIEEAKTDIEELNIKLEQLKNVESYIDEGIYKDLKEKIQKDIEDVKIANDEMLSSFKTLGEQSRDILGNTFTSIFEGDFNGAIDSMLSSFKTAIAQMLADQALAQLGQMMGGLGGGAGGGGGFGAFLSGVFPGRRSGGFVSKNQPYMVGETGPEIFYPNQSGSIDNMKGSSSKNGNGGSSGGNVVINFGEIQAPNSRAREEAANRIAAKTTQAIHRSKSRGDV